MIKDSELDELLSDMPNDDRLAALRAFVKETGIPVNIHLRRKNDERVTEQWILVDHPRLDLLYYFIKGWKK